MQDVADAVRALRGEQSLGALASASEVDKGAIWKIEQGSRDPSTKVLAKLAAAKGGKFVISAAGVTYEP